MSLLKNPYNQTNIWYHGSTTPLRNDTFVQRHPSEPNFSFFASKKEDATAFANQDFIYALPTHSDFGYVYSVEIEATKILDVTKLFTDSGTLTEEGKELYQALITQCGEDSISDIDEFFERMKTESYRTFEPTAHPFMWIAEGFFKCLPTLGYQGWFERELDAEFGDGLNVAILNSHELAKIVKAPYIFDKRLHL